MSEEIPSLEKQLHDFPEKMYGKIFQAGELVSCIASKEDVLTRYEVYKVYASMREPNNPAKNWILDDVGRGLLINHPELKKHFYQDSRESIVLLIIEALGFQSEEEAREFIARYS